MRKRKRHARDEINWIVALGLRSRLPVLFLFTGSYVCLGLCSRWKRKPRERWWFSSFDLPLHIVMQASSLSTWSLWHFMWHPDNKTTPQVTTRRQQKRSGYPIRRTSVWQARFQTNMARFLPWTDRAKPVMVPLENLTVSLHDVTWWFSVFSSIFCLTV